MTTGSSKTPPSEGCGRLPRAASPTICSSGPRHMKHVPTVAERVPDLCMVIDHIAKPLIAPGIIGPWDALMKEIADIPGVHCKVSGMVNRGRPLRLERRRPHPVCLSREGSIRNGTIDVRQRLAGVPVRRVVQASGGCRDRGHRPHDRRGTRWIHGRQRRQILQTLGGTLCQQYKRTD